MTTDAVPAGGDPRRLLADAHDLARRVRHDQRVTWFPLLVLAALTFAAIPADYFGMQVACDDGGCHFSRSGFHLFWPPALLAAYTAIAVCYVRVARSRGLGARVLPYAITGAALAALSMTAWLLAHHFWFNSPPAGPFPAWVLLVDHLIAPAGTIGLALLVLARLERNLALLIFTLGYLVVVLMPIEIGGDTRTTFIPQQIVNGVVLLLGAAGFALTRRSRR
ncbi:hypothetical protein [Actinoplanes derwentensis]|uniref:Uncharacterized protein n=1 Tax=Actinoplanes derwentensis TaxID=113562 RepID=A0A1H2D8C5_9ACTN|nr:hypothetical protein [Actinoplanes derwentensis]GID86358.1 hypothetical protein Ade03nite_52820 [Actinoplanes derwentensis]SDT79008.1 hypothetical protein SAMN04489716_8607 [Actinoplanes derwentensis]